MKRKNFSSIEGLRTFVKWGRLGLFLYLSFRSWSYLISRRRKRDMFSSGWKEPVASRIVQTASGEAFRVLYKNAKHSYDSIEIMGVDRGPLSEDIYPLV